MDDEDLQNLLFSDSAMRTCAITKFKYFDLSCVQFESSPKGRKYPWLTLHQLIEACEERGIDHGYNNMTETLKPAEDAAASDETSEITRLKGLLIPWQTVLLLLFHLFLDFIS